jgi:hypothetical protein
MASPRTQRLRWQPVPRPLLWRGSMAALLGPATLVLLLLAGSALAYARPLTISIPIGRSVSWPFVEGFFAAERNDSTGARWRWTESVATLGAPYVGPVTSLSLRLNGEQGGPPLTLSVAGAAPLTIEPRVGWQTLTLPVHEGAVSWDRDTAPLLRIATAARVRPGDPRALGVAVSEATLSVRPGRVPLALLGPLLAALLLTGALLQAMRLPRPWLVGCALALLAALALALPGVRLYLTVYVWRLLALVVLCWGLWGASLWVLPRIWRAAGLRAAEGITRGLAALMVLHFAARFGARSYPLAYASDLYGHVKRANLAADGQVLRLFLPAAERAPVQWEAAIAVPYSPFYYYVTGLLVWLLPFEPILILDAFSALVEATLPVLLAVLLMRYGLGGRSALWAGALVGLVPFGYVAAVAWALYPTLLGQWLALAALAAAACWYPGRASPRQARWQTGIMTAAFVAYLTALTFLGTAWATLLAISAIWYRRAVRPLLACGVGAGLLALALYYGWQLPALLEQAIPTLRAGGGAGEGVGIARGALGAGEFVEFLWERFARWYPWRLLVPAALGLALLALNARRRALLALIVAWCSIYPPFMLLDRFLPLLEKPQLHLLPAVALLAGLGAAALARKGRRAWLVPLALVGLLGWEVLQLGIQIVVELYGRQKF